MSSCRDASTPPPLPQQNDVSTWYACVGPGTHMDGLVQPLDKSPRSTGGGVVLVFTNRECRPGGLRTDGMMLSVLTAGHDTGAARSRSSHFGSGKGAMPTTHAHGISASAETASTLPGICRYLVRLIQALPKDYYLVYMPYARARQPAVGSGGCAAGDEAQVKKIKPTDNLG